MNYSISEIKPNIFLLNFKSNYDMAVQFMRYQEYYESPSSKFRGKQFQIIDFMKWYSLKYGKGAFTYMVDWNGFNIPGNIIKEIWDKGILDKNRYDDEMLQVYNTCKAKSSKFYLIGAVGNSHALKHEIAHGFFYTIPEYRLEMQKLVKSIDTNLYSEMQDILRAYGYCRDVWIDEIQAYLSTGDVKIQQHFFESCPEKAKPTVKLFKKVYNKYYKVQND